jgi:hypothetical protein
MAHYFIFRITETGNALVRQLEKIDRFDSYREAKQLVRQLRNDNPPGNGVSYKIMFAENELQAEEQLQEKREAPIIQEWEK